jgi:hypothetical protein
MMERKRPLGVTIVSILMIVNGIILVGGGVWAAYFIPNLITPQLTGDLSNLTAGNQLSPQISTTITGAIVGVVMVTAGIAIALGIVSFVLSLGLLKGKGWSWIITVILAIISLVFSIIGLASGSIPNIISIIINGVILYYMYRPEIKSYFGRVKIPK